MMNCLSCKAEVTENNFFCMECGTVCEEAHKEVILGFTVELKEKGTTAHSKKRYEEAVSCFTKILQILPDDPDASKRLKDVETEYNVLKSSVKKAMTLIQSGKFRAAKSEAGKALTISPGNVKAQALYDKANLRIREFDKAFEEGKKLLSSNRFEDAIRSLTSAQEIDPTAEELITFIESAKTQLAAWKKEVGKVKKLRDSYKYEEALAAAGELLKRRSFDKELRSTAADLKGTLQDIEDNMVIGQAALEGELWSEAMGAFERVLGHLPENGDVQDAYRISSSKVAEARAKKRKRIIMISSVSVIVLIILILIIVALGNRSSFEAGKLALDRGDYKGAIESFEATGGLMVPSDELEKLKKKAYFELNLEEGNSARARRNWKDARIAFQKALAYCEAQAEKKKVEGFVAITGSEEKLAESRTLADKRQFERAIIIARRAKNDLREAGDLLEAKTIKKKLDTAIDSFVVRWHAFVKSYIDSGDFSKANVYLKQISLIVRGHSRTSDLMAECRAKWFTKIDSHRRAGEFSKAIAGYTLMRQSFGSDEEIETQIRHTTAMQTLGLARSSFKSKDPSSLKSALAKGEKAARGAKGNDKLSSEIALLLREINSAIDEKYDAAIRDAHIYLKNGDSEAAIKAAGGALAFRDTPEARSMLLQAKHSGAIPEGMVYVPAGPCTIGDSLETFYPREGPEHKVDLDAFYVDILAVTNKQYFDFCRKTRRAFPRHWKKSRYPRGKDKHPVTGITLANAEDYARSKGCRLPTEQEWEKAARGSKGLKYPWGDKFADDRANCKDSGIGGTTPVGKYPKGKSQYGVLDMAGNVWEWTSTKFYLYPGSKDSLEPGDKDKQIIKGGSFGEDSDWSRASFRLPQDVAGKYASRPTLGFRCVKDAGK